MDNIQAQVSTVVDEWLKSGHVREGNLFVIGCSTSEVAGERIGTSGSEAIAEVIYNGIVRLRKELGVALAFQCCEHLNRALVVEAATMIKRGYEQVSAVPVPSAGGSMAAYAFKQFEQPVLVEHVQADAGIDIGETMIGMQLKHVAVPLRLTQRFIGAARVNAARTRPKLIGGIRAVYQNEQENNNC